MSQQLKTSKDKVREVLSVNGMSHEDIESTLDYLDESKTLPKWLVVLLKSIAYAIGLILAGYGTASAATVFIN